MGKKVRNWRVTVKLDDEHTMTSYVYDRDNKKMARRSWFNLHLKAARKNGLRGTRKVLEKTLEMTIVAVNKDGSEAK